MKLPRRYRILTALVALLSVLFMQLAVASYACPGLQGGHASDGVSGEQTPMRSMPDCDGPDPGNPALCQAHCQDPKSSLDKPQLPAVSPAAAILVSTILISLDSLRPAPMPDIEPDSILQRITSPPISIRHCCFRI